MAANRCFYDVLKLARAASQADIKAAYRGAALRLHPDLHQDAEVRHAVRGLHAAVRLTNCAHSHATCRLPICLPVCSPVHLSAHLSGCLPTCPAACLLPAYCLPARPPAPLLAYPSGWPTAHCDGRKRD